MKKYLIPAIFVAAFALRIFDLGAAQFWYDESFTALLSRLPLDRMLVATAGDTHPPLYYLITWCLANLAGTSEAVLRFPSVIFSMLSLWLTWRIAIKIQMSERVQVAVLVFMAINPMELHFAQEARMYTLFQAAVLWMILETLDRHWFRIGLAALVVLYCHNYGIFFVPVVGALAFALEFRHPAHYVAPDDYPWPEPFNTYYPPEIRNHQSECHFRKLIAAFLIPMLLYLPWFYFALLGQMETVASGYWIEPVTGGGVLYEFYMLFWGFAMPETWQPLAVILTVGLLVFALWRKPKRMLVWLGLVPLILAVALSLLWKPMLLFRGLIPSAPFLYLMIVNALVDHKPAFKLAYAGAILLPVILAGVYGFYRWNPTNKGDILYAINQVRSQWQPGDVIYHVNDGSMVGWMQYAPDLPQFEMNECGTHDLGSLSPKTRSALGFQEGPLPAGRVWVVWSEGPTSTACEHQAATRIVQGKPLILVRDDQYVSSGVWKLDGGRSSTAYQVWKLNDNP